MKLELTEGETYRYRDLMKGLEGGSQQFYLPYRGQQVFAAFLNRSKNPEAPEIILVGSKKRVAHAGALLARQQTPIPVFVKQSVDHWRYSGEYQSSHILDPRATKLKAEAINRGHEVIFAVVLKKADHNSELKLGPFEEGKCRQVTRNEYERNADAREACLLHHGYRCCVCRLSFEEEYGSRGLSFIHVHHLNPLHKAGGNVLTDPVKDLRPVCANCHAMIHAGGNLFTPEQLGSTYWSAASRAARKKRLDH